jgi:hypothetical protein
MKNKIRLMFVLPVFLVLVSCGTSSSIATSIGCSGNMLLEKSAYKQKSAKKRESRVKHQDKMYQKTKRAFL